MRRLRWILLVAVLAAIFVLHPAARLVSEYWWYTSAGYATVFLRTFCIGLGMAAGFGGAMLLLLLGNLALARRVRPRDGVWRADNIFELGRPSVAQRFSDRTLTLIAVFVSLVAALEASSHWTEWIAWRYGQSFANVAPPDADPLFGYDVGFYVFQLPLIQYAVSWAFFALFLALLGSVALHLFYRGIQIMPRKIHVAPPARRHLMGLLALMLAVKAAAYQLDAYGLMLRHGSVVFGANYTDVHAVRPALELLAVLALLSAAALLVNALLRGWKLSAACLAALLATSIAGQLLIPGTVQKFSVAPNELDRERPYIQRSIANTRFGWGLDHMQESTFPAADRLTAKDVANNRLTIDNIRLWDHQQLLDTYGQLQEIRTYYSFLDADNDRYLINGHLTQTSLSARELDAGRLPSRSWINEHLTYTHGFGACMGPVTRITSEGLPEFYVQNIPPQSSVPALEVKEPRIYFGERGGSYVLTNTKSPEFDYPRGEENVYAEYAGRGGVVMGSALRRLIYFLTFGEAKILLSSDIQPTSRILYHRNVLDMARRVTPMVSYDEDAYMVLSEGRLYWILDGYTTTGNVPYSDARELEGGSINYIRNSVKTVIDAYDGTVQAYVADAADPIIASYVAAFPGVYRPLAAMSADLRAHLRYPHDMFTLQADLLRVYHMDEPQVFYNKEDVWRVAEGAHDEPEMKPYYTITRLPGEAREEFILMVPFTPASKQNMIGWLAARCDGEHYGQMRVYKLPKMKLIYGPSQIRARINQDSSISSQITLWSQYGSRVIWGSLLVIPVEESIIYVQPLYLAASNGSGGRSALPELKRVIVAYDNRIGMGETLDGALAAAFQAPAAQTHPTAPLPTPSAGAPDMAALAREAREHLEQAEAKQRAGDWAGYGEELKRLKETLTRMESAQSPAPTKGAPTPP